MSQENLTPGDGIGIFAVILTILSFSIGAIQVIESWPRGCEYQTIADFAPPRAFVCELFRKRWNLDAPAPIDVPRRRPGDPLAPGVLP